MVKRQGDGVIIYRREARVANHLARRAEALQPAVQGRHHVGGGHFLAIVELHALAEVESERGVVVAHVVAFAQFRRNAAVRLQGDELLHHRAAQHVAAIDGGILVQVVGRALVVIGNVDDVQIVLCESCRQSQRRQQGQRHEQGEEFLCHFCVSSFLCPSGCEDALSHPFALFAAVGRCAFLAGQKQFYHDFICFQENFTSFCGKIITNLIK